MLPLYNKITRRIIRSSNIYGYFYFIQSMVITIVTWPCVELLIKKLVECVLILQLVKQNVT